MAGVVEEWLVGLGESVYEDKDGCKSQDRPLQRLKIGILDRHLVAVLKLSIDAGPGKKALLDGLRAAEPGSPRSGYGSDDGRCHE